MASSRLVEVWEAALADAGIDSSDAILYAFDGAVSTTGYHARSWRRGDLINEAGDVAAFGADLELANTDPHVNLRRVAVWVDQELEVLAGLVRHELEHTLQFETDADRILDDLYWDSLVAMDKALTDVPRNTSGEVLGGGALYNEIPMELDANSAASAFVRRLFGDERVDELVAGGSPHGAIFRGEAAPDLMSIEGRMRDFVDHGAAAAARRFSAVHRVDPRV